MARVAVWPCAYLCMHAVLRACVSCSHRRDTFVGQKAVQKALNKGLNSDTQQRAAACAGVFGMRCMSCWVAGTSAAAKSADDRRPAFIPICCCVAVSVFIAGSFAG